ncbi:MAG TPA: hypothetical protein VIH57_24485, partial [Bacteroidales bacterium]
MYHPKVKLPRFKLYCIAFFTAFFTHAFPQEYVKQVTKSDSPATGSIILIPDNNYNLGNIVAVHAASVTVQIDLNNVKSEYTFGDSKGSFSFEYELTFGLEALDAQSNVIPGVFDKASYSLTIKNDQPLKVFTKDLSKLIDNETQMLKIAQIRIVNWQSTMIKGNDVIASAFRSSLSIEVQYAHDVRPIIGASDEAGLISVARILPVSLSGKSAVFQWDNPYPYTLYQLQLLRLYNTDPSLQQEDHIMADLDWDKALNIDIPISDVFDNSTGQPVLITNNKTELTLGQGTGFYAWRIRPVGNYYEGGIANSMNW